MRRVLVLYSDERLLPANLIADEAIRATFAAESKNRIEFHSEFLDVSRFPGDAQQQRQRDFLRDKYRERLPDLVIAGGGPALEFLLKYRSELFADVPIVHCSVDAEALPKEMPDAKIAGVPIHRSAASTLELALSLQPDTRNVAVVTGSTPQDLEAAEQFRRETPTFADRVSFTWLTNLSLSDLRAELSRLPDDTVVLYLTMFQDAAGGSFTPRQALALFAPASRAPIYGLYDTYLGNGIVGGSMVTFEEIGRKAARLGMHILEGEDAQTSSPVGVAPGGADVRLARAPAVEHRREALAARQRRPVQRAHLLGAPLQVYPWSVHLVHSAGILDWRAAFSTPTPAAGREIPARERTADEPRRRRR